MSPSADIDELIGALGEAEAALPVGSRIFVLARVVECDSGLRLRLELPVPRPMVAG